LLLERISLAGIARAAQMSEQWMQTYVNEKYAQVPRRVQVSEKGRLTIQCDELWSFVDHKGNKQWVWLALDANTREIVGVYIGARDEAAARKLWASLPFSKSLENHIGTIWYFIHHYNKSLLV
jgi:transposase-like protein